LRSNSGICRPMARARSWPQAAPPGISPRGSIPLCGSRRSIATGLVPPRRVAAERERHRLERDGLRVSSLERCAADGDDGTHLEGLVKVYVPIRDAPASVRPYGFVFIPTREDVLALVALGERHPRSGTRSVYERRTSACTAGIRTSKTRHGARAVRHTRRVPRFRPAHSMGRPASCALVSPLRRAC
jgi:hypothetical protein